MRSSLRCSRSAFSLPRRSSCRSRSADMSVASETIGAREQATSQPVGKAKRPKGGRLAKLRVHLANIYRLTIKELRGIRSDPVMLALVAYSFTIAVYATATGFRTEATNLSVGIVDEDHSDLSRRIADGLTPPTFKSVTEIPVTEMDAAMDSQRFIYVIEFPPKFQADVLAGRQPSVQINVDATAVAQAFNGKTYIENVIVNYVTELIAGREGLISAPVKVVTRAKFNPNLNSSWVTSVMQIINHLTLLAVILTGAALIREREQGTVEHLLVNAGGPGRDHALENPGERHRYSSGGRTVAAASRAMVAAGASGHAAAVLPSSVMNTRRLTRSPRRRVRAASAALRARV